MAKYDERDGGYVPAARQGEDPGREGPDRPYEEFLKERRPRRRSVNVEKVERLSRAQLPEGEDAAPRRDLHPKTEEPARRSFNPNFDRENRPVGHAPSPRGEWKPRPDGYKKPTFGKDSNRGGDRERTPYQKFERDFNRSADRDRASYGARSERDYNRGQGGEKTPYHKPERDFNRPQGGDRKPYGKPERNFNRYKPGEGGAPRQGGFKSAPRDAAPRYDKENYPRFAPQKVEGPMRLNRFISMSGICSRREADEFITSGVVTVNGVVATELGTKIQPTDEVRFNDQVIHGEKKVYIVMNKPKGFVTSIEDPHADKTVMDLLGDAVSERVYPVGRLDKNSVGVLLITNDGDLTRKLTHPSFNKKKVYQVSLDKPISRTDMERITAGVELEDGFIAPDAIDYVGATRREVGVEIHSGRNRIVRRIFESLGYHVNKLDRVYFAGLTKQKLKRGAWRFLSPKEVSILKSGEYE